MIFLADFSDADAALDQYFSRSPPTPAGASLLAMVVNDDAGGLTPRGVLRGIVSKLAPAEGAFIETQAKKTPRTSRGVRGAALRLAFYSSAAAVISGEADQWNCSSSVEPVSAVTEDEPPWITVVMSSK
ncbi:hypothetical protein F7R06_29575 [Pseudomonas moorei]|nr:hypothetical protein F7R06_29575 [Pseudomonas moorei]